MVRLTFSRLRTASVLAWTFVFSWWLIPEIVVCAKTPGKSGADVRAVLFAYVTNRDPHNSISQYRMNANGTLTPLSPAAVPTGDDPITLVADPTGHFLYVGNSSDRTISQYRINAGGTLTLLNPPVITLGKVPQSLAVTPDGRFLYAANYAADTISQFRITAGGTLAPLNPPAVKQGYNPFFLTLDPTGRFAYVPTINRGEPLGYGGTLWQYRVQSDGALQPLPLLPQGKFHYYLSPTRLALQPKGHFAYLITDDGLVSFRVNASGTLTQLAEPTDPDNHISLVAFDPSGRFAYLIAMQDDLITYARVKPDGSLELLARRNAHPDGSLTVPPFDPKTTGANLESMDFDPAGRYAYIVNSAEGAVFQYKVGADGMLSSLSPATVPSGGDPYQMIVVQRRLGASSTALPRPASRRGRAARHR